MDTRSTSGDPASPHLAIRETMMMPNLDDLVQDLIKAERVFAEQKQLVDDLKQQVVAAMEEVGAASTVTAAGHRVTVVRGTVSHWDTEILKDILAPLGLWERARVLRETVDEPAIERMVDQNELTLEQLQPALEVRERRAYPKITPNKEEA